jgi:thiamine-phosphate pyrophosphorylase
MTRRQSIPQQWLIVDDRPDWRAIGELPVGSGILILRPLISAGLRRLTNLARLRQLVIIHEAPRSAARTHNVRELRQALLRRTPLILLSPIYPTRSHPDWKPMPRMRAASLTRLAKRRAIALGGMNARRYAKVAPLGFIAWAGISAFRT